MKTQLSYIGPKAEIRPSPIHGKGLFAREVIFKDEVVAIKGGYIFTADQLKQRQDWYAAAEISIAEGLFIGPAQSDEREGCMLFTNHSCEPNIGVQGQIVFVAMRVIQAHEELTHDWATTDHDDETMTCRCGHANCRKIISGQDWRRPELQAKYHGYFSWYLARKIAYSGG